MDRREFIKGTAAGIAAAVVGLSGVSEAAMTDNGGPDRIRRRKLGKTGRMLSMIGFGGIVVMGHEQSEANRFVAEAVERGINYFDVAPSYGDGEAETKLGIALAPYRKRVFLACKTTRRDRRGAEEELATSLKRLKTDYFDLYQLHALTTMDDLDRALASDGAIQAFLQARKEGRIRYIGFSAHSAEVALAAMDRFDFDTILFPINYVLYYNANFGPQVVQKAKEKNMGILALKMLARQQWPQGANRSEYPKCWYQPITDPEEAALAVRFTLSEPITAAVPPGDIRLFRTALNLAGQFKPLKQSERELLKQKVASLTPIFRLSA